MSDRFDSQEFHELMMDYRASLLDPAAAYERVLEFIRSTPKHGEAAAANAMTSKWYSTNLNVPARQELGDRMRAVFEAAVIAHGALFKVGKERRPDRPALEMIWRAVDAALGTSPSVEPLTALQCTRSHPHEEMTPTCELRTEIARLTNENARLKAAPPLPQVEPAGWQEVGAFSIPAEGGMCFHAGVTDLNRLTQTLNASVTGGPYAAVRAFSAPPKGHP